MSFGVSGQRLEAEIGLYFYNARFYDATLGRFAQADTIIPGAGNPLALDRYAYVQNNSLRYTDPSGHWTCSGGDNCEEWVQQTLDMLKNSGEMGRGVYHMFLAMDESDEIEIKFTSSSTASGRTPTKMTLGGWLWAKDPNPYSTAVFAHEFTHMVQASGDPHGNFSVASELEARIVEYYIKVELGHELSTSDKKIFELYDKNPDISKEDLKQFRNDYLLNGNLWWPENLGTSLAWMVYRFEPLTQGVGDFVLIQTFKLMGAHFSAESTAPAVPTGRKNMDIYIR